MGNKILTCAMVAKLLGYSPDHIRRLCGIGIIKAERLGHDWIIQEKDLKNIKHKRSKSKD